MFANANRIINKIQLSGVTLIELLLALTLALLISSLLADMYVMSQKSNGLQMALSDIQDNAHTAIAIINTEIHKAGYIGCALLTEDFPLQHPANIVFTSKNTLQIEPHEFSVRYADFPYARFHKMTPDFSTLYVSKNTRFSANDWLFLSDCKHAEIFQAKKIIFSDEQQKIIATHALHSSFGADAEVSKVIMNRYYIAKTHRFHVDGSPVYALFMEDINQHRLELIENIKQMHLLNVYQRSHRIGVDIALSVTSPPLEKHWYSYIHLRATPK
jgi:hypothetical protein